MDNKEFEIRLQTLYKKHHNWLLKVAYNLTKHNENSEDLVSELYQYLQEKQNKKIFYGDSYNLFYCSKFIKHRFLNQVKKSNKIQLCENIRDNQIDVPYDEEGDLRIQTIHEEIMSELKRLEATKLWPQSKIFQMYWCSDDTLDEVANKIGISKSTTFLAVKKIRKYLEEVIENPFKTNAD